MKRSPVDQLGAYELGYHVLKEDCCNNFRAGLNAPALLPIEIELAFALDRLCRIGRETRERERESERERERARERVIKACVGVRVGAVSKTLGDTASKKRNLKQKQLHKSGDVGRLLSCKKFEERLPNLPSAQDTRVGGNSGRAANHARVKFVFQKGPADQPIH